MTPDDTIQPISVGGIQSDSQIVIPYHTHNGVDSPLIDKVANEITLNLLLPSQTDNSGKFLTTNGTDSSWLNLIAGDGSDGALAITSGTTTIDCGNSPIVVLQYSSVSITGTGKLAFSNPHDNGTIVIILNQGNTLLTSSTFPMIDCSAMGALGGAAVTFSFDANGIDGSDGFGHLIRTHGGVKALSTPTPGAGGAVASSNVYRTLPTYILKMFDFFVGAGGASGCITASATSITSGKGGRGGGSLFMVVGGAWNFTTSPGISVAGEAGGDATAGSLNASAGGGGGGAGGQFRAVVGSISANTGTITISGGVGGKADNHTSGTISGGGGGGSLENAGADGTSSATASAKTGGNGGAGSSLIVTKDFYI